MKKKMAFLIALAMVLALMTGCGRIAGEENGGVSSSVKPAQQGSDSSAGGEEPGSSSVSGELPGEPALWLTVDNTEAYASAYTFVVEEDGLYAFETAYGTEEAEQQAAWEVYVLEAAFDDGSRYIPQVYEPCLTGEDGTLALTAGSWVYCFCSVDAFTGDSLPEGSCVLQVYQSAQPVESGVLSQKKVEEEPEAPETSEVLETPETPEIPETSETQEESAVITSEDAYDGAFSFTVQQKGMYTFSIDNAEGYEDVTWDIYVLEEPFEEAVRYIPQAETPALRGEGGLALTEGQVVYCFCSVNSFTNTLEEVTGASTLTYTISQKLR